MRNNLTVIIVTYKTNKKILNKCLSSIDKKIKILIIENSKKFEDKKYFTKKLGNLFSRIIKILNKNFPKKLFGKIFF